MTYKTDPYGGLPIDLTPHLESFRRSLDGREKSRFNSALTQIKDLLGDPLVLPNRHLLNDLPNRLRNHLREKGLKSESIKNYGHWCHRALKWICDQSDDLSGWNELPKAFPALIADPDDNQQRYWKSYQRFKVWCSDNGIPYDALNKRVFREYQEHLLQSFAYITARYYYSALVTFWKVRAQRWVLVEIEVPEMTRKGSGHYGLRRDRWPSGVREDFERFFRFSRYGETIDGRSSKEFRDLNAEKAYTMVLSAYLGYLVNIMEIEISDLDLRGAIGNEDWVLDFIRWHRGTRMEGKDANIHQRTLERFGIMLDELWRDPLGSVYKEYAYQIEPVRKEPRFEETLRPFPTLLKAAQVALQEAEDFCRKPARTKSDKVKQAVAFHNALLFALLILRPLREGNIIDLALGRGLLKNPDGTHDLVVSSVDEKGRKPYRVAFPRVLEKPLEEYLTKWRPILNQKNSDRVFMTRRGGRLTPKLLIDRTTTLGEKHLRIKNLNPHFFRSLVVSSYLIQFPNQTETVRQLLGHRRLETTLKYYIHIHVLHASRRAAQFARENSPQFRRLGAMFQDNCHHPPNG